MMTELLGELSLKHNNKHQIGSGNPMCFRKAQGTYFQRSFGLLDPRTSLFFLSLNSPLNPGTLVDTNSTFSDDLISQIRGEPERA